MGAASILTTKLKAHAAAASHRWPARRLEVIFISGADGGQLTAVALAKILTRNGSKVGLITANFIEIAGERAMGSDQADVLGEPFRLHGLLAHMRRAGCGYAIIDVPAHLPGHQFAGITPLMLVQRRCGDSYLGDAYNASRRGHWQRLLALRPKLVVANRDDPAYVKPPQPEESCLTYGAHQKAECRITDVEVHPKGSRIDLLIDHQTELQLTTVLTGKGATYSLVAAASAAYLLHVPIDVIEDALQALVQQPLELEYTPAIRPYNIVLDAAATPEGIGETLETLKHFTKNRLIAVLSANLAQGADWRPTVGELAARYADRLVVADGEYGQDESPQTVRQQLLHGIMHAEAEARTVELPDRMEALEKAISIARRGDTVVIIASTPRPYRQLGKERLHWNDTAKIEELLG